jgi:hypothetical protein
VIAPAIIGAMPHDPDSHSAFLDGVIGVAQAAMTETISLAVSRGEVNASTRLCGSELGQARLWHRFLSPGDTLTTLHRTLVDEFSSVLKQPPSPTACSSVLRSHRPLDP